MSSTLGPVYVAARIHDYSEGYVNVLGYWLFYRSFGEPGPKGTILCIHGGPGAGQDHMTHFAKFAEDGYRVVMYDQLGAGKSSKPPSELLYTMERYVDEIEGVRQTLNLGKVHMFGASFGAFLNVGYATKYSKNLLSLMAQSGTSSSPLAISEMLRLRNGAPRWVPETLDKYEAANDFHNPEYLRALEYLYRQHLCRLDPLPPYIQFFPMQTKLQDINFVYKLMWGLHEFYPTGNAKYWDVTGQLDAIDCPTLVTCGRHDEITPKNSELLHSRIMGSKLHIFENCSHMPRLENPEEFSRVHREFLGQLE